MEHIVTTLTTYAHLLADMATKWEENHKYLQWVRQSAKVVGEPTCKELYEESYMGDLEHTLWEPGHMATYLSDDVLHEATRVHMCWRVGEDGTCGWTWATLVECMHSGDSVWLCPTEVLDEHGCETETDMSAFTREWAAMWAHSDKDTKNPHCPAFHYTGYRCGECHTVYDEHGVCECGIEPTADPVWDNPAQVWPSVLDTDTDGICLHQHTCECL
jgi:hypothetical protein